jgi:hypothetical protein
VKEILTAIALSLSRVMDIDTRNADVECMRMTHICKAKNTDVEHFDGENFFFLLHIFLWSIERF